MSVAKQFNFQKVIGGNVEASVFAIQDGTRSNTIRNITDLSGTKWLIKKPSNLSIVGSDSSFAFNINYTTEASNYTSALQNNLFIRQYIQSGKVLIGSIAPFIYPRMVIVDTSVGGVIYQSDSEHQEGLGDVETTLEIIDGTDVTNADLIAWLEANATLVEEPVAENKISFGNLPISKVLFGSQEVSKMFLGEVFLLILLNCSSVIVPSPSPALEPSER